MFTSLGPRKLVMGCWIITSHPWRLDAHDDTRKPTHRPNIRIYPMIIPWFPRKSYPKKDILKKEFPAVFCLNPMEITTFSGWWLTYPSEKYEFVSWDD